MISTVRRLWQRRQRDGRIIPVGMPGYEILMRFRPGPAPGENMWEVLDTQRPGQLRTGPADGTTVTAVEPTWNGNIYVFEGASDIGLMPPGVVAIKDWGRDTQPLAWGRTQPETRPAS